MKGVVFVVLAACIFGALAEEASNVVVLKADNFDAKTKEGLWLIKFFAPWCGHCKRLAPTWIELAGKTEGKFNVGEVDCTAEKDLCSRFGVRGYPTIKFIANGGAAEDVRVPRTVEAYTEYIEKYLKADGKAEEKPKTEEKPKEEKPKEEKPKTEEKPKEEEKPVLSLTQETIDAEMAKKPLAVKFFAPWCGHCKRLAPTWEEFAKANKDGAFTVAEVDCTVQKDLCNKYGIRGYPTIKFLRNGESPAEYNGARTKDALQTWADGFAKKDHSEL